MLASDQRALRRRPSRLVLVPAAMASARRLYSLDDVVAPDDRPGEIKEHVAVCL